VPLGKEPSGCGNEQELDGSKNQFEYSNSFIANGMYFYTLSNKLNKIANGKFIVNKIVK
jgi:hypothetical protein